MPECDWLSLKGSWQVQAIIKQLAGRITLSYCCVLFLNCVDAFNDDS